MIKKEDINLVKFPRPMEEVIGCLLDNNFDRLNHLMFDSSLINYLDKFDFLEEIVSAYMNLFPPESITSMLTGLEIWLKDHPEYLNKKEPMITRYSEYSPKEENKVDKKYVITLKQVGNTLTSVVVSDGENFISFSDEYLNSSLSDLIDDFDDTINYKDGLL